MDQRHERAQAAAAMLLQGVAAGEDQGVEAAQPSLDRRRLPPDLRRPAPARQQRTQFGASHGLRSYFQSRCIGQISQCSCAVMIRTARRFVPRPSTPGPPTSEML